MRYACVCLALIIICFPLVTEDNPVLKPDVVVPHAPVVVGPPGEMPDPKGNDTKNDLVDVEVNRGQRARVLAAINKGDELFTPNKEPVIRRNFCGTPVEIFKLTEGQELKMLVARDYSKEGRTVFVRDAARAMRHYDGLTENEASALYGQRATNNKAWLAECFAFETIIAYLNANSTKRKIRRFTPIHEIFLKNIRLRFSLTMESKALAKMVARHYTYKPKVEILPPVKPLVEEADF